MQTRPVGVSRIYDDDYDVNNHEDDKYKMTTIMTTLIMMFADQARWRVKPRLKRTAPGGHHCRPAPQSFIFFKSSLVS